MPAPSAIELLAQSATIVAQVVHQGRSLDEALQQHTAAAQVPKAALQALTFGTLRWHPRLAGLVKILSSRRADATAPVVHALLCVGLHQLNFSRHPDHAIGNAAVQAARVLKQPRAAGFVNAVLRQFLRVRESLNAQVMSEPVGRFAHPRWLIDRVRADWPDEWAAILDANNRPPPMWLRVNRQMQSRADYLARLAAEGIKGQAVEFTPDAIRLEHPVDVGALPGFTGGHVSVQDAAAQLAAGFLDAAPGMRVLDACAAPGGKACHILERTPQIDLIALDRSTRRLRQVEENFMRLKLIGWRTVAGDAASPQLWADSKGFHRILLDAPCSASGVIRRHPDIKLLRRDGDIEKMAAEQLRILRGLWPSLQPGGRLLYATCSVLDAENTAVIARFLDEQTDAAPRRLQLEWDLGRNIRDFGLQLLPGEAGLDGFYYACLEKQAT